MLIAVFAGVLVGLFLIGHGVALMAGLGAGYSSVFERAAFAFLQVLSGILILAGLLRTFNRPLIGAGLILIGVLVISVLWYWAVVITVPIGVVLVITAYRRARRQLQTP